VLVSLTILVSSTTSTNAVQGVVPQSHQTALSLMAAGSLVLVIPVKNVAATGE
jgi:hypothetical protein